MKKIIFRPPVFAIGAFGAFLLSFTALGQTSYDSRANDAAILGVLRRQEQNQRMERFQKGLEQSSQSMISGPGIGIIFWPLINAIDRAEMRKWEYIFPLIHDFDGPRLSHKEALVLWKDEKKRRRMAKKQNRSHVEE